jgi:hypothetical protein
VDVRSRAAKEDGKVEGVTDVAAVEEVVVALEEELDEEVVQDMELEVVQEEVDLKLLEVEEDLDEVAVLGKEKEVAIEEEVVVAMEVEEDLDEEVALEVEEQSMFRRDQYALWKLFRFLFEFRKFILCRNFSIPKIIRHSKAVQASPLLLWPITSK